MNQILDHSGPKKQKIHRNPGDTARIIRVFAFLIMIFAICLIAKAGYSLSENKKINTASGNASADGIPQIELNANNDILSINVKSTGRGIESVSYQWYKGNANLNDIRTYQEQMALNAADGADENDDEDIDVDDDAIAAMGDMETQKSTAGGQSEMNIQNIGIPKGDSTIHVVVKTIGSDMATEYAQHYYTDVGIDKINPQIKVALQGKKLIVTAVDENEIDYLTYSINDAREVKVDERENSKTIKTEIELSETSSTKVRICAVDKAKNSSKVYEKDYDVYAGKPEIKFEAEPDFSKIYVVIDYARGLKSVKFDLNGEESEETFDNPEDARHVEFEVETKEGHNVITVWAYTEQEQVWSQESGECDYEP